MSPIVNRSQQVYRGAVYPISAYSRVVSIELTVPDTGITYFHTTPPVGNKVWLLQVKIMVFPKSINAGQGTGVRVLAGSGHNLSLQDVLGWENVLPLYPPNNPIFPWTIRDGIHSLEWDMTRLYEGKARRFAVTGFRGMGLGPDEIYASFQIAEG